MKTTITDVLSTMKKAIIFAVLALASTAFGQWTKTQDVDQLRGTQLVRYSLDGVFLTAPSHTAPDAHPTMIVQCTLGDFKFHTAHGKLVKAYIVVGTVLGSDHGEFRLDDGKVQQGYWSYSTDYSSIFLDETGLANLLYGHMLLHKENTTPPVKKVVISVSEHLAGEVVMQFTMPDPTEVADACGVIVHKRGH